MAGNWWKATRAFSWLSVRCYYRSFRVEGAERIPGEGPVLFVLNHPNSLLDPAALMLAAPRPVHFAAKGPLFAVPLLGGILRRLGAVPVDRPGDGGADGRRNLSALGRMAEVLRGGGACAIFPEGLSHADPELKPVKSGPARIALEAEEGEGWALGLRVVPVGLSFHPRQAFRGDVVVRVGTPFSVADLREAHRREAIRTVQERIATSLRPLIHHLDRVDLAPLVDAVADLYAAHRAAHAGGGGAIPREQVRRVAGAALNHFLAADPAAVEEVAGLHRRLERLSGRAGVPGAAVDFHDRPGRAFLAFAGRGLLLVAGFPVFVFGLLTSLVPYRLTDRAAAHLARREGSPVVLPLFRVLAGLLFFGLFWGALALLVHSWSGSPTVTAVFAASLLAGGLAARAYATRARRWREGLEALLPFFARRGAVARVARARAELLTLVEGLRERFEAASGAPLLPAAELRPRRRFPWVPAAAVLLAGALAWYAAGFRGTGMEAITDRPSPWRELPAERAAEVAERDARALAGTLQTLVSLEARMAAVRADIESGRRTFFDPSTDAEIRSQLLTYLACREGLLRLAWFYREPDRPERDLAARGFLLGYGAGVELCARGIQLVDAFDGHPDAVRKLNEGDPAGEVPRGTYDRIRANLADRDLLDMLAAAAARFGGVLREGALPAEGDWPALVRHAGNGEAVVARLAERIWNYKWDAALARAVRTGDEGRYAVSSVVSTWIGDARVRRRAGDGGLVTPEQVATLRTLLRPGDILVERRNWYLSNAFLPGFWKHAALYTGRRADLEALGVADHPSVAPHLAALDAPDHDGHHRVILEAISEGVVFTSLEESVGGADAVCVFRPRLPPEAVAAAVVRGIAQHGKPYDFDFDFFSTDRLVCTELVYQAYHEPLRFPLREIMGRRTLPALDIVRRWEEGRREPEPPLDLLIFLDADEAAGTAREAGPEVLAASMARSGLTPLQEGRGGLPLLLNPATAALAAMLATALWVFRRRGREGTV